jgi:hypothetical protein
MGYRLAPFGGKAIVFRMDKIFGRIHVGVKSSRHLFPFLRLGIV